MVMAGCGGGSGDSGAQGGAPSGADAAPQTLNVFAAASLKDTFTTIEKQFEQENPGTDVTLTFAGSSDLATQINNGAPADVFASADDNNMKKVTDPGLTAAAPARFATNTLQIAVAPNNPKGITSLAQLADPANKVVVCAPQVPCGSAAQKVEKAAGVDVKPVSEEQDVKSVLSKVTSGNADAGLVYVTDVTAAKDAVQGVSFPDADKAVNNYPIAALKSSKNQELANKWVQAVTGPTGQQTLKAAGFGAP
ncbi:molybdate ABC transporter substrate-binding protein [Pseudonocardia sp. KRD291]|uniref:molybdate ABC transporter substrate-binding protein n=1 Tax=Pseudonocardia sp. KRD291 TaxID=2792007 RepID=UPI001C4A04B8|nr:molybdate ABC transporter substrate-binding protein [Pseudonocardia sp. KRD291]